ncbi:FecR family protein [Flavobacterium sp. NRK F10]|uniref:Iron dicitrate transport regulator FecR n=1 Tax=Flavobacterium sediminis TaxID=2201181 RepID=A0A2U8QSV4_9FLAO|nr:MULTISPECIES: FecR family protein [Flavobacterium]AWM12925.1 iron dicitrate transport regulator FecR [Flavobacterium sediminis]MCO6174059.1 FecR family protein [Flavobacterium sp. NRK F10]
MDEKYYLAKWLNDELEGEELIEFEKSPEFHTYLKIKEYSNQLTVPEFDKNAIYENIMQQQKEKPKIIPLQKNWFLKIAAILILSIGLGTFMFLNFSTENLLAKNGEKNSFVLPDHSKVILNSGSEISYKKWNWDSNRKLNLKGEAFFKVAKGKKFEVQTELGKVTVLGTQFNVKNREDRFEVTCYEGKVRVNYNNKELLLTKGMQVIFENDIQTDLSVTVKKPDWMNNEVSFHKETLIAVLNEIERQYNVTIENKSTSGDTIFTGKIPTNDLDIALKIVSTTFNLKVIKKAESLFVLESN